MTVHPRNIVEKALSSSHLNCATNPHPLSVRQREDQSPPSKKLRLSLKGQRILNSLNHSTPGILTKEKQENLSSLKMQNIRPNLLDPMGIHASYTGGGGLGLVASSYQRTDAIGDDEIHEHYQEKDRGTRLDSSASDKGNTLPPVASLLNLGNTCFLNSVLYTLRFTPGFAHLLHHLTEELSDKKLIFATGAGSNERKTGFLSSGSPGTRTKSLSSLSPFVPNEDHSLALEPAKKKTLVLTERLHELFQTLHNAESKGDLSEPYQADAFLQALREVNPLFQGNQQQDAHELLVCFLDYLREACQLVDKVQTKTSVSVDNRTSLSCQCGEATVLKKETQNLEKKKKGKKIFSDKNKDTKRNKQLREQIPLGTAGNLRSETEQLHIGMDEGNHVLETPSVTRDFISESFEGVTVLRTTCLECEFVTERKESFMDICVPIISENTVNEDAPQSPSAFFASTLMEVDFLRDTNKYWCEQCVRYNEARRSVHYEKLPRLLVLQLKRFSLSFGSTVHTSKVNDYMPTPLQLDCFCEHCQASPESPVHSYKLYAIIMHLGATMASGHYVAYTRICQSTAEYVSCSQTKALRTISTSPTVANKASSDRSHSSVNSSASGILRFFKPKSSNALGVETSPASPTPITLCRSLNCCIARPRKLFADIPEKEKEFSGRDSPASTNSSSSTSNLPEDVWLECDDEVIRVLRMRELEDLLSRKPRTSALTPYILFYTRTSRT